jgi:hypothetical protein
MIGSVVALVGAVAGATYQYGRARAETENRAEEVDENREDLSQLMDTVHGIASTLHQVHTGVSDLREEVSRNRRDLQHQNRLLHDELVEDEDTCGNPYCAFCHPETRMASESHAGTDSARKPFTGPLSDQQGNTDYFSDGGPKQRPDDDAE